MLLLKEGSRPLVKFRRKHGTYEMGQVAAFSEFEAENLIENKVAETAVLNDVPEGKKDLVMESDAGGKSVSKKKKRSTKG